MSSRPRFRPALLVHRLPAVASGLSIVVGAAVLLGWLTGVSELASLSPNWVTMKANTAICFILAGVSLLLLRERQTDVLCRRVGQLFAVFVIVLSILVLLEWYLELDFGIDQMLVKESPNAAATSVPGRMSMPSAVNFILIEIAVLALPWRTRRGLQVSPVLATLVALSGLFVCTGYLYGVKSYYAFSPFTSMALTTAVLFIALAVGVLSARPDPGPVRLLIADGAASQMAWRLLPVAVVVPMLIGWLQVKGEECKLFGEEMGGALFGTAIVLVFFILIWRTAVRLERSDAERRQADASLREMETARQVAVDADRVTREFVASMSHELRTPLNGIIGFSELLLGEEAGPLLPMQKEFVGDVLSSGRNLLQLVNDVLDLSQLEAGKMYVRPERFSLQKVVDQATGLATVTARTKAISIHAAIDPALHEVVLDRQKLTQILYNLLSNAVKFTNEGGRVDVRLRPIGARRFQLQVQDTGIGIRADDIPRLFKAFTQLDSGRSRHYGGSGLGLMLTKRLVELQHGSIAVASEPDVGSTFTVELPLSWSEPSDPTSSAPVTA
jgi:signal transduction histidine kinase